MFGAAVWRRARRPISVVWMPWLDPLCAMVSTTATPLKSMVRKPLYTLEKQRRLLDVVRAVHEEAGRPSTISIKARFRVPFSEKYPIELHGARFPVSELRKEKREGRLDRQIVAGLDAIGFVWDYDQYQWQQTQFALTKYKEIHGDLLVHFNFDVPTGDVQWPRELWAKKLGSVVHHLRTSKASLLSDKKQWLNDVGFVWDAPELHWNANLSALKTYKAIHGHLTVPTPFVVPHQDAQWPRAMWGLKLGTVVSNLRNAASTLPPQKRDALNELGFVWRLVERGVGPSPPASISLDKQTQILQVVECQRAQQPHTKFVNLPSRFKVPSTASWPRHLHKCVVDISTFRRAYNEGRLQPSIVQALDAIHFVWNDQNHQWNLKLEALAIYRATYHDVLVGQDFVIPPDDSTWPVYLWGKKLGAAVLDFRLSQQHLSQAQRDELDAIGFVWDAIEDQWQVNYAGLATYKSIYGHLQVPQAFVVPDNDPKWPPKLWNTRLASVVHHLRHCNLANERRDALDALGFVWNPLEVQWNRNLRALAWFKTMHGHVRIPRKFVVPDQSPTWPQDLWNMKLGMTAFNLRIRSRQDGYPANRLDQLSQLGLIEPN